MVRSRFALLVASLAGLLLAAAWAPPALAESESFRDLRAYAPERGHWSDDDDDDDDRVGGAMAAADQEVVLVMTGVIGQGAYRQFQAAISGRSPRLVILDGPGGILGEALLIGQEIRRRGLNTLVAANGQCASACAIVFLSGRTKFVGNGALIGLHSASFVDGRADPTATGIMAEYLGGLGVPPRTLRRMAQTAPSDIRWLNKAEQKAVGIRAYPAR